jgi:SAM-dependent methyltransferase
MSEPFIGPLRLYDGSRAMAARGPAPPLVEASADYGVSLGRLADQLACQEMLRGPLTRTDAVEPLSLQWYLQLEQVRHNRQGRWIPALLEFGKHRGEKLLGLGSGLGSDLIQYARQGAEVVAACASGEQLALLRRNFELRGLGGVFLHASPHALPIESSSIDVACVTGLLQEAADPAGIVEEVYRVLKPGGKVLAVVPAYYDIEYWARLLLPVRGRGSDDGLRREGGGLLSPVAGRFKRRGLRRLFERFQEPRISKRHLRRAEVPHLWRWLPLSLLERLAGRLLVFKGFKPVSASRSEQAGSCPPKNDTAA